MGPQSEPGAWPLHTEEAEMVDAAVCRAAPSKSADTIGERGDRSHLCERPRTRIGKWTERWLAWACCPETSRKGEYGRDQGSGGAAHTLGTTKQGQLTAAPKTWVHTCVESNLR